MKDNLAQKPAGGDREQVSDVHSGKCDLAIGNTYYMALMLTNDKKPEQKEWAEIGQDPVPQRRRPRHACQHLGLALVAKHAPNKDNAVKLMEFLASDEAQQITPRSTTSIP